VTEISKNIRENCQQNFIIIFIKFSTKNSSFHEKVGKEKLILKTLPFITHPNNQSSEKTKKKRVIKIQQ
jgi:hypothetical protein